MANTDITSDLLRNILPLPSTLLHSEHSTFTSDSKCPYEACYLGICDQRNCPQEKCGCARCSFHCEPCAMAAMEQAASILLQMKHHRDSDETEGETDEDLYSSPLSKNQGSSKAIIAREQPAKCHETTSASVSPSRSSEERRQINSRTPTHYQS
jgi:hypothetical protein